MNSSVYTILGQRWISHNKAVNKIGAEDPSRERGSVLVVALLILVILTIIGISVAGTAQIGIQIAGNGKFHKIAFYHAESGIYLTPKLVRDCLETGAQPTLSTITYLDTGTNVFYREILGFNAHDSAKDIRYTLGGNKVEVDVERTKTEPLPGGGAEFGSGAEGIGVGAVGGVAIYYTLDALGEGPSSSRSNVEAVYRMIPGVAGGM